MQRHRSLEEVASLVTGRVLSDLKAAEKRAYLAWRQPLSRGEREEVVRGQGAYWVATHGARGPLPLLPPVFFRTSLVLYGPEGLRDELKHEKLLLRKQLEPLRNLDITR